MIKINKIFISFIYLLTIFFIAYILIFNDANNGIILLPLVFFITIPILNLVLRKGNYPLTTYIYILLSFSRYCLLPFLVVLYKNTITFNEQLYDNLILALSLMIYEHLFLTILLYFIISKPILQKNSNYLKLKGSKSFYVFFISMSLLLYLFVGRNLNIFDFGIKSIGTGARGGDVINTNTLIIREIILWGLYFTFFLVTEYYRTKYSIKPKPTYVYIALLFALLLINVIIGERRSQQLFMGFATCITLISVFPSYQKLITRNIVIVVILVLAILSAYKYFNAFMYDSYFTAIENTDFNTGLQITLFDQTLNGMNSLLMNLNFLDQYQLSFRNFIFDFFRNIFGLHFIFKGDNLTTTELYNYRLYYGDQLTGYLFTGIAYGYAYGGFILAPVFTALNLIFSCFLERKLKFASSIEVKFVIAILFIRIAIGIYTSPPSQLNMVTRTLIIFGLLYFLSRLFSGKLKFTTN